MGNFRSHGGNHEGRNKTFPFLQLAQAYIDGVNSVTEDPGLEAAKEFECAQLAMTMRCMEEFWYGRKDVALDMWRGDVIRPHISRFETTSMINVVHNEKQLADALDEIGMSDLIGFSDFTAPRRSMKKGQIALAEAYVLSKITARKRSGKATNRVRETNAKLVMRMDSMRIGNHLRCASGNGCNSVAASQWEKILVCLP